MKKKIVCPDCQGSGSRFVGKLLQSCDICGGSGYITEKKKEAIKRSYLRDELSETQQRLKSMKKLNRLLSKGERPFIFNVPNEGTFIYPSKKDEEKIRKKIDYDEKRIEKLKKVV